MEREINIILEVEILPEEIHLYNSALILSKLKTCYEKKCYKNYYIIEIISIMQTSGPITSQYNFNANDIESCDVKAKVISVEKGDLIIAYISDITDNIIICKNDIFNITIEKTTKVKIDIKDVIVVEACRTDYIRDGKIAIFGVIFQPFNKPQITKIHVNNIEEVDKALNLCVNEINKLSTKENIANLNKLYTNGIINFTNVKYKNYTIKDYHDAFKEKDFKYIVIADDFITHGKFYLADEIKLKIDYQANTTLTSLSEQLLQLYTYIWKTYKIVDELKNYDDSWKKHY